MNSLRARLLLAVLGLLALAVLLVGSIAYRNVRAQTEALFDYQLRQMALSLRDQGEIAPAQASALVDEQLDFVVQVWTSDGRAIYATRRHEALPQRAQLGFADVRVGAQVWRSFSVAMPARVIQVSQPLAIRRQLAADAAWRAVLPLLLIAPFMAAAAWWLTALALRPLQRVAADVRQRDAQSLAPLPAAGLPDEVAPLVAALNALLQRLGQSLEAQRAFVADAAHELRSPLTALKLQLQLLRRAGGDTERAAAAEALGAGIERAARLVEQLLALARSEPGAAAAEPQRLDLSELVRQAVADTVPLALARDTRFTLLADLGTLGDEARWRCWRATWPTTRCATHRTAPASKCASRSPTACPRCRSTIQARASPRPSASACSTASTAAARATSPAAAWGWRSCAASPNAMAPPWR